VNGRNRHGGGPGPDGAAYPEAQNHEPQQRQAADGPIRARGEQRRQPEQRQGRPEENEVEQALSPHAAIFTSDRRLVAIGTARLTGAPIGPLRATLGHAPERDRSVVFVAHEHAYAYQQINVEQPGKFEVSDADTMLAQLG
jgi:hypothetical protein